MCSHTFAKKSKMKHIIYTFFFISFFSTNAQVGIGTTSPDPSSILDVNSTTKGILLPRLTTSQRNAIASPANGLIIYNTDTNNIEYNSNTSSWTATNVSSTKFTNTNTTTNLNTNVATNIPIFGAQVWNDNNTIFTSPATNTITISQNGRYRIVCNISLVGVNSAGSSKQRTAVEAFVAVDGVQAGAFASSSYIRYANGHDTSSIHINEVLNLSVGDVISIKSIRGANSGAVRFNGTYSNILIEKIK